MFKKYFKIFLFNFKKRFKLYILNDLNTINISIFKTLY